MTVAVLRCPQCGELNLTMGTTAEPRLCQRCGEPVATPAQPPSAQLARERLLGASAPSRLPPRTVGAVDIDIDNLEAFNLSRLPLRKAPTPWPPEAAPCELPPPRAPRPLPTPAPLPRPEAAPFPAAAATPRAERRHRRGVFLAGVFWLVGAVGLAGLAAAQAIWLRPALLDLHPVLRLLAERGCAELGCTLPERRDPIALHVVSSRLEPVAGVHDVAELEVRLRNAAGLAQPLPVLRLTLLDIVQRPVAQRSLPPAEYLPGAGLSLTGGGEVDVRLLLEAPERQVAGFQVDLVAGPADTR